MVNYNNGKIYKIVNDVDDKIYIGSTCVSLSNRKSKHKDKSKLYPNRNIYKHILSIGWHKVSIILIESFRCDTKEELTARERHWMDELKPELNMIKSMETEAEYRIRKSIIQKKSYARDKTKWNTQEFKDKAKARSTQRVICVCSREVSRKNLAKHKKSTSHMKWVSDNHYVEPIRILVNPKEILTCECGAKCQREGISRHRKCKTHLEYTPTLEA